MSTSVAQLKFSDIAEHPAPGFRGPTHFRFSPDGAFLYYLGVEAGAQVQSFLCLELGTGRVRAVLTPTSAQREEDLSAEEKLRRERARELSLGVTRFSVNAKTGRVLIPVGPALWVLDGPQAEPWKLHESHAQAIVDARMSPDGTRVAFCQGDALYALPVEHNAVPHRVAHDVSGKGRTYGQAEFIAQEEMARSQGYWWAADNETLIVSEVDETHIPRFRINHLHADTPEYEEHAYAFAGGENARVGLFSVNWRGGARAFLDTSFEGEPFPYIARVRPLRNGETLVALQNRAQTELGWFRMSPAGPRVEVHRASSEVWVNLYDVMHEVEAGPYEGALILADEDTGFCHLKMVHRDGTTTPLTEGEDCIVEDLLAVDEVSGWVYFSGHRAAPRSRHLYRTRIEGAPGPVEQLTQEAGWHQTRVHTSTQDPTRILFVDQWDHRAAPPVTRVYRFDFGPTTPGLNECFSFPPEDRARVEALQLKAPELRTFEASDGSTLHGALYLPETPGPHPLLVSVYGGPHAQRVQESYRLTADLRAQHFCARGFAVLKVDNRGSARRGLHSEAALHRQMGTVEIEDQCTAVACLVEEGLVDATRVGMYGWSYGGYMSALSLMKAPEVFRAAVAGAPVTHWDGYDTHYTERYMGTPANNPQGYEDGSVMAHASKLKGALMIVHGGLDENVHFRHSARLAQALTDHQKDYTLLYLPKERHVPRGKSDRTEMERKMCRFFCEALNVPFTE